MIYVSPDYKERHINIFERIKNSIDISFCTDIFIYAVMDVAGFKFENNDDVKKYTPFK